MSHFVSARTPASLLVDALDRLVGAVEQGAGPSVLAAIDAEAHRHAIAGDLPRPPELSVLAGKPELWRTWIGEVRGRALKATEPSEAPPARPGPDFRSVHWFGADYTFTKTQAACVALLWDAWEKRTPELGQEWILARVEAESNRLVDLFKGHPAWGTMIVKGSTAGSWRLAGEPPAG